MVPSRIITFNHDSESTNHAALGPPDSKRSSSPRLIKPTGPIAGSQQISDTWKVIEAKHGGVGSITELWEEVMTLSVMQSGHHFFPFFGWHLEAFALQHGTLLLAVCGKLMGPRQRLTQMTFEWAKHLSLLGFGGQSQFRVRGVCSEGAQWGATRDWSLFFLWHLTALFETHFIRNM